MIKQRNLSSFIISGARQVAGLLCLGWLMLGFHPVAAAVAACDFAQAVKADVRLVDGHGGSQYTVAVDDQMRDALTYLHGFGLWHDGPNGTYGDFTTPRDIQTIAWITLTTRDGHTRWVWFAESPSAPGHAYAWVFTSLQATTDSHGDHYGTHQMCATVDVPLEHIQALLIEPSQPLAVAQSNAG